MCEANANDEWNQMIELANKKLNEKVSTKKELLKQSVIEYGINGTCDFLGLSHYELYDELEKCGYKKDNSKIQWSLLMEKKGIKSSLKEYLEKRITECGTTKDVAEEFGCTQPAILYRMKQLGIKSPSHGGSRYGKIGKKYGKVEEAFLSIPRNEIATMNIKQISERLNCDYQYAWFLTKKHTEIKTGYIPLRRK